MTKQMEYREPAYGQKRVLTKEMFAMQSGRSRPQKRNPERFYTALCDTCGQTWKTSRCDKCAAMINRLAMIRERNQEAYRAFVARLPQE